MWTVTNTTKCCATCSNWGGNRRVNYASHAETDSQSARGKCYEGVFSGVTEGHRACDGRNCAKYRKWSAL